MARTRRIKKDSDAHYHLMSRTNDRRFLFESGEVKSELVSALPPRGGYLPKTRRKRGKNEVHLGAWPLGIPGDVFAILYTQSYALGSERPKLYFRVPFAAIVRRAVPEFPSRCNRILHAQSSEPSEIRVCRNQNKPMFHCKRGKVGVCNEFVVHALHAHKRIEKRHVPFCRNWNPRTRSFKPCVNLPPCVGNGYCRLEYSRICRQTSKRRHAFPRNAKRNIIVVQRIIKPPSCLFVLREGIKRRIHQNVGVHKPHRKPAPSANSSISCVLAIPSGSNVLAWNTLVEMRRRRGFRAAASLWASAMRRSPLTSSLKLMFKSAA